MKRLAKSELEEAGYQELANSMPHIVWTAMPNGNIDFYNDRWYQFSGFKKGEWPDEGRKLVLHPEDYPHWEDRWQKALQSAEAFQIEYRFKEKSGTYRWFLGRAMPSKDNQGRVKKWYGTCTDIHDQKLAQAEREKLLVAAQSAETASKLKSQFVANMSHEIRTPLNGIIGMINILKQSKLSKEQHEFVQIISDSSAHLRSVVDDILDLSKIESNRLHLDLRKFNLRDLAKNIYSSMKTSASSKNIAFRFHIQKSDNLNIVADSIRIKQVLINLIQNAIKFTNYGYVEVRIKLYGNGRMRRLCVEVKDTGIGIAEPSLENVFNAFTQADSSITRQFGGTGLGLSICRKLVEMMKGEIAVHSIIGKGSIFSFSVPVQLSILRPISTATKIRKSKRSFSILVAEDNEINQKVILHILRQFGHKCEIASDGEEALQKVELNHYDLILMDYHMPKIDGLTAIKRIRKLNSEKAKTPIFALTADAFDETKKKCLRAGANGFVSKPIETNMLFDLIENLPLNFTRSGLIDFNAREKLRLFSNEAGFLDEITNEYCANTKQRMRNLEVAIDEGDFKTAFYIAHMMKSSSGQLGAEAVQKQAFLLEKACRAENKKEIRKIFKNLQKFFLQTLKELEGRSEAA